MDSDIEDTEYDPDDDLAVDSPSEDYGKNGTLSWLPSFQNMRISKEKWNLKGNLFRLDGCYCGWLPPVGWVDQGSNFLLSLYSKEKRKPTTTYYLGKIVIDVVLL